MSVGLLTAFLCFCVFLVGIIVMFHTMRVGNRFKAMGVVWFILLGLYVPLYFYLQPLLPEWVAPVVPFRSAAGLTNFFNGILVYLLAFLAFCCLYTSDHGLSIAFMIELEGRPNKQMTMDELKQRFPYDALLRQRLADLEANSFVVWEGEYVKLAAKGRRFAGFLGGLKKFLGLEPGG